MTENTDPLYEQASREATDWLLRLQEAPEDADLRREFEAWRQQSPHNAAAWAETKRVSEAMRQVKPRYARKWRPALTKLRDRAEAGRAQPDDISAPEPEPPGLGRRLFRLGAVTALAYLAVFIVGPDLLLSLRADFATGTAETRTLALTDGSRVTLAPESAVKIAYTPAGRELRLLAGRAFFEVTAEAERPFRVTAKAINVTVLGTDFSVDRNDSGAGVSVEQGRVRVEHGSAVPRVAETLGEGEALRLSWAGRARRGRVALDEIAAWRRHRLIVRDQPLAAVVDELRPYHGGRIVVTDMALAARTVTGVYNLKDPGAALRAIARAHNAVIRYVTPWLILVSAS